MWKKLLRTFGIIFIALVVAEVPLYLHLGPDHLVINYILSPGLIPFLVLPISVEIGRHAFLLVIPMALNAAFYASVLVVLSVLGRRMIAKLQSR